MNTQLMDELERQLLEVIGLITLNEVGMANQQLVTMVHGLRIINNACKAHPMTIGELQQAQFDRATEIEIEDDNDFMRLEMDREATASLNEVAREVLPR